MRANEDVSVNCRNFVADADHAARVVLSCFHYHEVNNCRDTCFYTPYFLNRGN